MPDTPHLALPFRVTNGRPAVNEQGSLDDVAACVRAVLLTRPGERDALPDFGTPDFTFQQLPVDLDALVALVEAAEPRARVLAEQNPDLFREAVLAVRLTLTTER